MGTTEIVLEQVLVGALVLVVMALPFMPHEIADGLSTVPKSIPVGIALAGLAYLLGPSFDRLADTILGGLERRARLRFAWEECCDSPLSTKDPFPEADLRFDLLREGNPEALGYLNYLRTRMRVSRALAIYMPALTVSALLVLPRPENQLGDTARAWILVAVAALYAVTATIVELHTPPVSKTSKLLPFIKTAQPGSETPPEVQASISNLRDPLVPCATVFVLGMAGLAGCELHTMATPTTLPWAVAATGILLTGVAGWAWQRIALTHHRFLCQFARRQWSERSSRRGHDKQTRVDTAPVQYSTADSTRRPPGAGK